MKLTAEMIRDVIYQAQTVGVDMAAIGGDTTAFTRVERQEDGNLKLTPISKEEAYLHGRQP